MSELVENHHLDAIDREILTALQRDARISNAALARRVSLSATGVQKRLRKLEATGVIRGYTTQIDHESIGYDMLCFVHVTLEKHDLDDVRRFRQTVCELAEVLESHHITGEFDYVLKVLVRNRQHLERFLMEKLTPIHGIAKIRTSIVLSELKANGNIPL